MNKSIIQFIKIFSINLILLFISSEVLLRLFYYKTKVLEANNFFELQNDPNYKNYLNHVNHSRESEIFYFPNRQPYPASEIKKYSDNLPILNKGEFSEYIYTQFSDCTESVKQVCNDIVFQGDSWSFWIGTINPKIIFGDYLKKNWRTFSFGTGSFSPANMSGQLKYMNSIGIKPRIIIAFIDQTDYFDDSVRYWHKISEYKNQPFLKVDIFNKDDINTNFNTEFFNNDQLLEKYRIRKKRFYSFNPILSYYLKEFLNKYFVKSLERKPNKKNKIVLSLSQRDDLLKTRFEYTLLKYIESAQFSGANKLFLFSHPHRNHILENPSTKYLVNVKDLIDKVLKENKYVFEGDLEIYHKYITLPSSLTTDRDIESYFLNGDTASHPNLKYYGYIAEVMKKFIQENK